MLRKLWRELLRRRGSLFVLAMIAATGVGCYVGLYSVYMDLETSRARFYRDCRLADFTVYLKRAPANVLERVARLPNVREVQGRVSLPIRVDLPGTGEPVTGLAISLPEVRKPLINDVEITAGSWFGPDPPGQALVVEGFGRVHGLRAGDHLKALMAGRQHDLVVSGRARSPEFVYIFSSGGGIVPDLPRSPVLYVPERYLQESADLAGAYNQLVGLVADRSPAAIANTLTLIEETLEPYGVTLTAPQEEQTSVQVLAGELKGLKVSATIMPGIFLGVVAMLMNVVMGRLIAHERGVIGTLRALGYSWQYVGWHYLGFGWIVGLAGGLGGLAIGLALQEVLGAMYRTFYELPGIVAHPYPVYWLQGVTVSLVCALSGTALGIRTAVRLEPAEAMRPPPPEIGKPVFLEAFPWFWRRLSFAWKMVLRAVLRNPFRSGVALIASLMGTALVVEALCLGESIQFLLRHEYQRISHQDLTVILREPVDRQAALEMASLPGAGLVEPELVVTCDVSYGSRRKRVGVTGMLPGQELYTPVDEQGRRVAIPEKGLILTGRLAELVGVKAGDIVRLRPLIGRRDVVEAPVVGVVQTYLGLTAYARLDYLSRLLGERDVANTLLVRLEDPDPGALFLMMEELRRRPSVTGVDWRQRSLEQMSRTLNQSMGTSLSIIIFFAGLLSFGSVLNTVLVSLNERQREVGTLRVLGYNPGEVAQIFFWESLVLNSAGILLGLPAGYLLVSLVTKQYTTDVFRFPVVMEPHLVVTAVGMMLAFILAAQLVVYRVIKHLPWLDVLKVRE